MFCWLFVMERALHAPLSIVPVVLNPADTLVPDFNPCYLACFQNPDVVISFSENSLAKVVRHNLYRAKTGKDKGFSNWNCFYFDVALL